jgi:hypothetical protein
VVHSGHPGPGGPVDLAFGAQPLEQAAGHHHRLDPSSGPGRRPSRREVRGDLLGVPFRVVGHPVDQPESQRLGGVHPAAGQHHVHGRTPADQVRQQPGAHRQARSWPYALARAGPCTLAGARLCTLARAARADPAQPRTRARDPQVRRGRQLRAAAHRGPGDHRDHRTRPGDHGLAAVVDQIGDDGPFGIRNGEIGPCAEHLRVGAAEQDGRLGFGRDRVPDRDHQAHVQRVAPFRPGQP